MAVATELDPNDTGSDLRLRTEPAHDEVYVRLPMKDMDWPSMLPAVDAIDRWVHEHSRQPAGAIRQVLIADQRHASPESLVCDLTVPLK